MWWIIVPWLLVVGGYALVSLLVPPGRNLTTFGDIVQCLVPLFANAGLLLNAASPNWRRNSFWMLLAMGCSLWMIGQLQWTYVEVYLGKEVPNPFIGDVIFFLHTVPMIAALALLPHSRQPDHNLRYGSVDFSLLLLWWMYLYLFIVIPWQYVQPNASVYGRNYVVLYTVENFVFVVGLAVLWLRTSGSWRTVYAHLAGAAATYTVSSLLINVAIDARRYYTGSLYDLPLVASLVWFGTAGIIAKRLHANGEAPAAEDLEKNPLLAEQRRLENGWPTRLAMAAVLSLPVLAGWCLFGMETQPAVRDFRLLVTIVAIAVLGFLVFLRQSLVDADRLRLLRATQDSVHNLKRLQTQFVQSEKLASLGQLAAGAAHEINNPLTAILGYSDMLIDDATVAEKPRSIAQKIRDQARRTTTLVNNLLSFARQVPAERTLLDVNTLVTSAIQLRRLDLRGKNIKIELFTEKVLPGVRGDSNQLLQVFYNIISNAVDAMEEVGGGSLIVRTLRDHANVVIEFSDTGPGIKDPQRVFDPFYTTKPVGKGTGLGLSICYGLVQEHDGHITCFNRPEGGAAFRVELPALLAMFPIRDAAGLKPTGAEATKPPVSTAIKSA